MSIMGWSNGKKDDWDEGYSTFKCHFCGHEEYGVDKSIHLTHRCTNLILYLAGKPQLPKGIVSSDEDAS